MYTSAVERQKDGLVRNEILISHTVLADTDTMKKTGTPWKIPTRQLAYSPTLRVAASSCQPGARSTLHAPEPSPGSTG
jgi:hypothetical protein